MPKGKQIAYSTAELDYIRSVSTWPRGEAHAAFCQRFGRDDITLSNFHALCKRRGWFTGRTGCFAPGQEPPNKGKRCEPGKGGRHPNARRTQFRKGERRGVAVKLWKPIGTERLSKDGYLERKIHNDMPLQSRWRAVHLIEWEAINGPLPAGHCLKCLGDKSDTSPANWVAIPRALLPRLAGGNRHRKVLAYDDAEPAVRPAILALAKLEHAARKARRS